MFHLLGVSAREARLKNLSVPLLCFMRRLLSYYSNFLKPGSAGEAAGLRIPCDLCSGRR